MERIQQHLHTCLYHLSIPLSIYIITQHIPKIKSPKRKKQKRDSKLVVLIDYILTFSRNKHNFEDSKRYERKENEGKGTL